MKSSGIDQESIKGMQSAEIDKHTDF